MTIFHSRGFDSIIGKGMVVNGNIIVPSNSTLTIEGKASATLIESEAPTKDKVAKKTTLRIGGTVGPAGPNDFLKIIIHNVIITGNVDCDEIRVDGTLAVKSGCRLTARKIFYRDLIVETGAIMHGEMFHLDHLAEVKQQGSEIAQIR